MEANLLGDLLRCVGDPAIPKIGRHPNPLLCFRSASEVMSYVYVYTGRKWPATLYRNPLCEVNSCRRSDVGVTLYEVVGTEIFVERYQNSSVEHSLCRMIRGKLEDGQECEVLRSHLFKSVSLLQPDLRSKEMSWSAFTNHITDADTSNSTGTNVAELKSCDWSAISTLQQQIAEAFLTEFAEPPRTENGQPSVFHERARQNHRSRIVDKMDKFMSKRNIPRRAFFACVALFDEVTSATPRTDKICSVGLVEVGCITIAVKLHSDLQLTSSSLCRYLGLDVHSEVDVMSVEVSIMQLLDYKLSFLTAEEVTAAFLSVEDLPTIVSRVVSILLDYCVRICTTVAACAVGAAAVQHAASLCGCSMLDRFGLLPRIPQSAMLAAERVINRAHRNILVEPNDILTERYENEDAFTILARNLPASLSEM